MGHIFRQRLSIQRRLKILTIGNDVAPLRQLDKSVLKYLCLHPSESSTDFEVKDDSCFDCSGLCAIKFHGMLCSMMYLPRAVSTKWGVHGNLDALCYDGAESCPLHGNISLCLSTDAGDLQTNVLPFSITIRPDHQHVSVSGLR